MTTMMMMMMMMMMMNNVLQCELFDDVPNYV